MLTIFEEMDKHIQYIEATKQSKRYLKNHKPFWTEDLFPEMLLWQLKGNS